MSLALPLPRPGLFFLWFKDKTSRFGVVPPRPRPRRGPRCAGGRDTGQPRHRGVPPPFPPAVRGLVFWLESLSTWVSPVCVRAHLIREEVTGFSVFKTSGLLAINLLLLLSLQTLAESDTRGEPPAALHRAVLPEPCPAGAGLPGEQRPLGAFRRQGERDPAAANPQLASKVSFTFMKVAARARRAGRARSPAHGGTRGARPWPCEIAGTDKNPGIRAVPDKGATWPVPV